LEVAGNVWRLCRDHGEVMPHIVVFAGRHFLPRFSNGLRKKAERSLTQRGIRIVTDGYVTEVNSGQIRLESGAVYDADFIMLAQGVKPAAIFQNSGLPTGPDGGLRVNRFLQCSDYPEIFGGGDCIYFEPQPLDKVGVYAVRQNPFLYHNLAASLAGKPLMAFDPGGDYLLVFNMGDGTGILQKRWIIMGGRLAFKIKDYIDRKFMARFQRLEAPQE